MLPLRAHTRERPTHDYVRLGTIDLSAALNLITGMVIHQLTAGHRAAAFRKFLNLIDKAVPADLQIESGHDRWSAQVRTASAGCTEADSARGVTTPTPTSTARRSDLDVTWEPMPMLRTTSDG